LSLTKVTMPELRAVLDDVRSKGHDHGVVAVQALPVWQEPLTLDHHGTPVSVVTATSVLAIREALLGRQPYCWLVILTDRSESDLGLSVRAHFTGQRLHRPDAWVGVRQRFAATRVDHRLVVEGGRELATGVLRLPTGEWQPAAGGFLTADHLCSAVAATQLSLRGEPDLGPDLILKWSNGASAATRLAELRAAAGNVLTDFVLAWISRQAGPLELAAGTLLRNGRASDLIPLGLVARAVVESTPGSGPRALFKQSVGAVLSDDQLRRWSELAEDAVASLQADQPPAAAILDRGEILLGDLDARPFAAASPALRSSLADRFTSLGHSLISAVGAKTANAVLDVSTLVGPEEALGTLRKHLLARGNVEVKRAEAGVRLLRWLCTPITEATALQELSADYLHDLGWVDRAVSDAWSGVDSESLSLGLQRVLQQVRRRRAAFDSQFAAALAKETASVVGRPTVMGVETLLADVVLPIAAESVPVLLIVADGMNVAVATEVLDDLTRGHQSWSECVPVEGKRRLGAHAVLPTLTAFSRTSLFCGTLAQGARADEQAGFKRLCQEHGLTSMLFHKADLERSEAGFVLSGEVAKAMDDIHGTAVVACVLNTVDDALDRSDPGGTTWTSEMIKHLEPLVNKARRAGRIVILTADHGHVVERRQGRTLTAAEPTSNRSRMVVNATDVQPGEVYIEGSRVMSPGGKAILAVDELVRYGPIKAGYHGGAAPAEVVVPVAVLTTGEPPTGWIAAAPQTPLWWHDRVPAPTPVLAEQHKGSPKLRVPATKSSDPTLFDDVLVAADHQGLGVRLVGSAAYKLRRKVPGGTTDGQMGDLVAALEAAAGNRLSLTSVATTLQIPEVQLPGAIAMVQRLLNVDQYPVLTATADQRAIVLDLDLLTEQFGLRA
jgi:hypothetical protein